MFKIGNLGNRVARLRYRWPWVGAACVCALVADSTGCTRKYYRVGADKEVAEVIAEKDRYEPWRVEQAHVYPDPRARFADPTNPDRPPMPPDDPAAYQLSPHPQKPGKAGVQQVDGSGYLELLTMWDQENRREDAAAKGEPTLAEIAAEAPGQPLPYHYPPAPRKSPFLLRLEQAAAMGLFNSREYQDRREDLYLAALPVTLSRFSFAAQFFATEQAIREYSGRDYPEGPQPQTPHNQWRLTSATGFSKVFSTGALLMLRFANLTAVEMTGSHALHTTSSSNISLDFLQPLLRGGGQAVTLEPLTQDERNLLYEIRNYARFREEYFVSVATGAGVTASTVSGGVASGRALAFLATGTLPREGYLPTVLSAALLDDQHKNVAALENFLRLFEAYKEGGDVSQLQVDQVEQQLLQARSGVLRQEEDLQDRLDRFKFQIGLPMTLGLRLDQGPIRPMLQQLKQFDDVFSQFEEARNQASAPSQTELALTELAVLLGTGPLPGQPLPMVAVSAVDPSLLTSGMLVPVLRERLLLIAADTKLVQGTQFRERFPAEWESWRALTDADLQARLLRSTSERRALLDQQADLERVGQSLPPEARQRLATLNFQIDVARLEQELRRFESRFWEASATAERRQRQYQAQVRDVLNLFVLILGEARNERLARLRSTWPELPPACVSGVDLLGARDEDAETVVTQTTLANRYDLLNARAQLVDAWRKIAVNANALLGTLNVAYHMDTFTPPLGSQPFDFAGSRTRNQLIFNGELPLVRVLERNNYRATLIGYQRQRRALMLAEDVAVAQVRAELRQLRQLAENYRIQQRAVELAYLQVESSLETFRAPPIPSDQPSSAAASAGNAAALTQQLLNAQRAVLAAEDQLFTFWVNYQATRLQLYRDLEMMRLDSRGVWIDESATHECRSPDGNGQPQPAAQRQGAD